MYASRLESRDFLRAYLDGAKYDVKLAAGMQEALEKARTLLPEVVVAELSDPESDGVEFCRALRAEASTSQSVLIVLGKSGDEVMLQKALEAGADDYLLKPFRSPELEMRIDARRSERSSEWRPVEQEALLELSRMLASSLDLNQLLHLVAVRTAQVLQVDRCSFVLLCADGEHGRVVAASESATLSGVEITLWKYPEILEVVNTRMPLVIERVEDHVTLKALLPMLSKQGVGSVALFPMIHEERVEGVLFLRSERFGRAMGKRDIFFANAVAASVALSLRNVLAVERERQVASELQRTKGFLENLIDSSGDAILAADTKGNIILFNKGAERLYGYSLQEVVGKVHSTHLYPPGGAYEIMGLLRAEGHGGVGYLNAIRREVLAKNGEQVPVQLTAWIVMENGKEVATAGILTDLRERLKMERKLFKATEKLGKTEKQAAIAELAGAAAHELNQPLTSVLGYTELAKRKVNNPGEIDRILDIILSETERMADIVRKIGRITRYETKSYVGEQRIVDLDRSSEPDRE